MPTPDTLVSFEALAQCRSEPEVREAALHCVKRMGLHWWAFSMPLPLPSNGQPAPWCIGNLPDHVQALWHGAWPGLACGAPRLLQHGIPQAWTVGPAQDGAPPPAGGPTPAPMSTQRLAAALGITGGICTPVAGDGGTTGFLTLAANTPVDEAALQAQRPAALLLSRYLHLACQPFITDRRRALAPHLSRREVECLSWAAMGKTAWEIGRVLAISEHTAVYYLRNAHAKLGAVNRHQAIARSIQIGILAANGRVAQPARRRGAAEEA